MSDRSTVYKTPFQRLAEVILVLIVTVGCAFVFRAAAPGFPMPPAVILSFVVSFLTISWLGSAVALRLGGSVMSAKTRSRRYLDEMIVSTGRLRPFASNASRRTRSGRSLG